MYIYILYNINRATYSLYTDLWSMYSESMTQNNLWLPFVLYLLKPGGMCHVQLLITNLVLVFAFAEAKVDFLAM